MKSILLISSLETFLLMLILVLYITGVIGTIAFACAAIVIGIAGSAGILMAIKKS